MPEIQPIEPIFPTKNLEQDNKNRNPKPDNLSNKNEAKEVEEKIPDPYKRGQVFDKTV